jgi:glycerol uptake facilitator-like aquaporin
VPHGQPGLAALRDPWRIAAEGIASASLVFGIQAAGLPLAPLDAAPVFSGLLRAATVGALVAAVLSTLGQLAGLEVHPLLIVAGIVTHRVGFAPGVPRLLAQCAGGLAGGWVARLLAPAPQAPDEFLATQGFVREAVLGFALVLIATGAAGRSGRSVLPAAVGLVSGLSYWVSGSTSAAHPVVLLVRALFNGALGLAWVLAAAAQLVGAVAAALLSRWLFRPTPGAGRT